MVENETSKNKSVAYTKEMILKKELADWEVEEFQNLVELFHKQRTSQDSHDAYRWRGGGKW